MASTPSRVKSALSTISSSSSHLEPPEPDLRTEQRIMSSEEAMVDLRKRDRDALARLTGKKVSYQFIMEDSLVVVEVLLVGQGHQQSIVP